MGQSGDSSEDEYEVCGHSSDDEPDEPNYSILLNTDMFSKQDPQLCMQVIYIYIYIYIYIHTYIYMLIYQEFASWKGRDCVCVCVCCVCIHTYTYT